MADDGKARERLALAVGPCDDIGVDGIVVEVNNINVDAGIAGRPLAAFSSFVASHESGIIGAKPDSIVQGGSCYEP